MNENRLPDYLEHISQAANEAITFTEGLSKDQFAGDKKTQNAVVMSLLIVGEAATKVMDLYPDFSDKNSHVPWKSMRGMRNRIAHGYFDINLDVVWDTVQIALPELLTKLKKISGA